MWRHEDIFFAAIGGGELRPAPGHERPRTSRPRAADGARGHAA